MSDVIARLNAALEGRYEIDREIGEGGMATVYLARDVKHNRNVAVKVLKPELAAVVGADRFLAEIETTANLQHPHILPLFDSGEADSFLFYVMPYIDGETLRDRLDREKQLPVEEAIGIASAVANALQTAHDAGVVHRDIKPGNILMSQGEPLVSDFGIALAVGAAGGNRLTETGLSVGTPYYMSPEQATGDQAIGPQTDTYALACVLYEMLVGEPPYTGNTAQAVLGKILMGEPVSATAVRASIPANVDGAIRKALEKLPADRFTGAHGFARALGDTGFRHGASGAMAESAAGQTPRFWKPLAIASGLIAVLALAAAAREWTRPVAPPQPAVRAPLDIGDEELFPFGSSLAVSPDGSMFAMSAGGLDAPAIYVRTAAETSFRMIPGTEGGVHPTFSPDGEWIAYVHDDEGTLSRVSVAGGAPRLIVTSDVEAAYPHWGDDGTILFNAQDDGTFGTYRVPDTGGEPVIVLEGGNLAMPRALPGGRFILLTNGEVTATHLLDLDTDSVRVLVPDGVGARYSDSGHLLYVDLAGGLWAVPFDLDEGKLTATPTPVLDAVTTLYGFFGRVEISQNGTLLYGSGGVTGSFGRRPQQLVVVDEQGSLSTEPLEPRVLSGMRWSPEGGSVAYSSSESNDADDFHIFTYDVDLGTTPRQLTFTGDNYAPVWSPDGTRVVFSSARESTEGPDLFVKTVDDDSPPTRILSMAGQQRATDWVDETIVFQHFETGTSDIWTVQVDDSASATPYHQAEWRLNDPAVSPGGDLLAYSSNETGTPQVYVRSFPEPRQPVIVSDDRGVSPRWSPDSRTLYYWKTGPVDTLYAARVRLEPTFAVESREAVLAGDYAPFSADLSAAGRWALPRPVGTADADEDAPAEERYFVVTNWFTELRAALGEDDR